MIEVVGWLGGSLLAFCALPQVLLCIKTKSAQGVSRGFIGMWGLGEILTLIYVLYTRDWIDWPLVFNYLINLTFIGIISWYMIKERK